MRPSCYSCYKSRMRIQGPGDGTIAEILAARRRGRERVPTLLCLALIPALAGCSSFSSSSPAAANSSPATYQTAGTAADGSIPHAAPASDPPSLYSPYPSRSLVEVFSDSSSPPAATGALAPAQGIPHPPNTYTASAPPYQLNPTSYNASASPAVAAAPAPPAVQDSAAQPVPVSPYPQQSLSDIFSR